MEKIYEDLFHMTEPGGQGGMGSWQNLTGYNPVVKSNTF